MIADRIALLIGYAIMWLLAGAVVTAALAALMRQVWLHVIRPAHLLADYQEWRMAKARGLWRWPEITSKWEGEK